MRFRSYILLLLPALFIVFGMLAHNVPVLTLGILVPASFICAILCLIRGIKTFKSQIVSGLVFISVSVLYLAVLILLLMPVHFRV